MPLFALMAVVLALKLGVPFVLGAVAGAVVSFRIGQYHRGYTHARGIRKSHWAQIQGRGH